MKIGEFAEKYHMKASAVRYYIDRALITPERENNQYIFTDICIDQMDKIVKLKDYGFTLDDISLIMSYENLSDLKDKSALDKIISMFAARRDAISDEIIHLDEIVMAIDDEIDSYSVLKESMVSTSKAYVPLKSLALLRCPVCGSDIKLENADIEPSGITRGKLTCSCGYYANIINGVLVCNEYHDESPLKAFDNVNFINALTEDYSSSYRALVRKSHLNMYQTIVGENISNVVVLSGPLAFTYTLNFLKTMPSDNLYIIFDYSIQKIRRMKEYLADSGRQILFIVGNVDMLPLKSGVADMYIDDFSSANYSIVNNENLFESLKTLLKDGARVIGHYIDYHNAPESLKNFRNLHPQFNPAIMSPGMISSFFSRGSLKICERYIVGSPEGNKKHFKCHVPGESVLLVSYQAVKVKSADA